MRASDRPLIDPAMNGLGFNLGRGERSANAVETAECREVVVPQPTCGLGFHRVGGFYSMLYIMSTK